MSKTFMIAQREVMENLHTKTFWIGIIAAPIGMVLFYVFFFLIANKTDRREYVVIDKSEWLSEAVHKRAASNDLAKLFELKKASKDEQKKFADRLQKKFKDLESDHPLRDLLAQLEPLKIPEALQAMQDELDAANPDAEKRKQARFSSLPSDLRTTAQAIIYTWGMKVMFDPEKKAKVIDFMDMTMKKFVLKPFDDQGEDNEKALMLMLQNGEIFAYFIIGPDPLNAKEHGGRYVSQNVTDNSLRKWFQRHATECVRDKHIRKLKIKKGLLKSDVANIRRTFSFEDETISETGDIEKVSAAARINKWAPVAFVYALWIAIFVAATMLLTNTIEEKSNRIIEVLLSSVSPTQLMHGKIFGIGATGLLIVGSWAGFAFAGIKMFPIFLPDEAAAKFAEFELDAIFANPLYVASFLGYFLSGYLLYAALLVAIGSVCNSLKEAQNLQQPVMFALFVPLATMIPIATDPNGTIARLITYIPLYTPFAMMNRAGGPPPLWEYALSTAIILVSLWIAFRGAAKVFRVGVLMTGKPPKIREIIRWMRAPTR